MYYNRLYNKLYELQNSVTVIILLLADLLADN